MKHNLSTCAISMLILTLCATSVRADSRGVPVNNSKLQISVHLVSSDITLQDALISVSKQAHINLLVDTAHENFQDVIYADNLKLSNLMIAIAWANRMYWKPDGNGFLLTQTADEKTREQDSVNQAKKRHQYYREARIASFSNNLQKYMLEHHPNNPAWNILQSMSARTVDALGEMAIRDMAAYPSDGDAHTFRNYLFGLIPYGSLPADIQENIDAYFRGDIKPNHSTIGSGFPSFIKPSDLSRNMFGFYTYNGILTFAIISSNNSHVWWEPNPLAHRDPLPGYDINDDDTDPHVDKLLPRDHFDLMEELPSSLSKPTLHFVTSTSLPNLMQQFSQQTKHAVICQRFVNSISTRYHGVLTFHSHYTLPEAMREVDRAFGYHSAWFGGMLVSRTTDPGRNIMNEPPLGLVNRMVRFAGGKGKLTLDEIRELATFTHTQWINFWYHQIALRVYHTDDMIISPAWRFSFMQLLSSLSQQQLDSAESMNGLPAKELTPNQLQLLILATDVGPLHLPEITPPPTVKAGFKVEIAGNPDDVKSITMRAAYPYLGHIRETKWTFKAKMND